MMLLPKIRNNFSFFSELWVIAWSAFCTAVQNFLRSRPNFIRQLNQKYCSLPEQIGQPCCIFSTSEGELSYHHRWVPCYCTDSHPGLPSRPISTPVSWLRTQIIISHVGCASLLHVSIPHSKSADTFTKKLDRDVSYEFGGDIMRTIALWPSQRNSLLSQQ